MRLLVPLLLTAAGFAVAHQPLHLDSGGDREAFRRWFTFLAEAQFYAEAPAPEVNDCAALVRWTFREALTPHDSLWADRLGLKFLPALPPVRQFTWPHTPAGANLFQTSPNSSAQFADAATLRAYNTYFVSRDLARALPGDLLFYRQFGRAMPAHVMIFVGPSQFEKSTSRWLVYHTGPIAKSAGEMRKVAVADLLSHPAPEWRPLAGNSNFLGVWRLNLLRDSE